MWVKAKVDQGREAEATRAAASILKNYDIYHIAGSPIGVPAWVVGVIHYRESGFKFGTWLANGDPLLDIGGQPIKTVRVPIGLGPCAIWESAATASLVHRGWGAPLPWDLCSALLRLESYNGWGYHRKGKVSPYIWAGTDQYVAGKYASDGVYDPNLKDKQLGCAVVAQYLKMAGVDLNERAPDISP